MHVYVYIHTTCMHTSCTSVISHENDEGICILISTYRQQFGKICQFGKGNGWAEIQPIGKYPD